MAQHSLIPLCSLIDCQAHGSSCHIALMVEPVIAPPRSGLEHTAFPEVRVSCVSAETLPECFGSEER